MATNNRTNRVADWTEAQEGERLDAGPYIGIVKENRDPLLSGRIQVWIPEFGGIETDPKFWRTISYAGPYIGSTVQEPAAQEAPSANSSDKNSFKNVRHTYGMWFNVPDLENWVLCTFVGGDPARGYWFACIPNQLGHHMVPAIGSSTEYEQPDDPLLKRVVASGEPYPVAEFNEYANNINWTDIQKNKKPIHEPQLKILLEQGLDRKSLTRSRGIIGTSSQRETPSGVFGFSTPGRPAGTYPAANATSQERKVKTRLGGHTFVMDDGDETGQNNLTRWRSAGGHQILMDDTEKMIYITNSSGTSYIEMNAAGHINIYASNSINLRTKAEFNLHADSNMNINVGGSLNVNVKNAVNIQGASITARGKNAVTLYGGTLKLGSDGRLDLYTTGGGSFTAKQSLMMTGSTIGLNSGSGPSVTKPRDLPLKSSADTKKNSSGQWEVEENKIQSVASLVPTHEPWNRKAGVASSGSNAIQDTSYDGTNIEEETSVDTTEASYDNDYELEYADGVNIGAQGDLIIKDDLDPGIEQAVGESLQDADLLDEADMLDLDAPSVEETVGPLNPVEVKALMLAGQQMSDGDYGAILSDNAVGAYALNAGHLVESGYLSRASIEQYADNINQAIIDEVSWTGKDGMKSVDSLLASPSIQSKIKLESLQTGYRSLLNSGGLKLTDPKGTVGGMLNAAATLSITDVTKWRMTGSTVVNAYGVTATKLFNQGADAVKRLGRGP